MTNPLVILTKGTHGQRRYYLEGKYQNYMSAGEVHSVLKEVGFRGHTVCVEVYKKLERREPLSEGQVGIINRFLEDKLKG